MNVLLTNKIEGVRRGETKKAKLAVIEQGALQAIKAAIYRAGLKRGPRVARILQAN